MPGHHHHSQEPSIMWDATVKDESNVFKVWEQSNRKFSRIITQEDVSKEGWTNSWLILEKMLSVMVH